VFQKFPDSDSANSRTAFCSGIRLVFVSAVLAFLPLIILLGEVMPRRKQARRTSVKDLRSILRLTYEQGLSVREVSERLKIGKTSVSTYLLRAREAGLRVGHLHRLMKTMPLLKGCCFIAWAAHPGT
jgi:hypothetical protein